MNSGSILQTTFFLILLVLTNSGSILDHDASQIAKTIRTVLSSVHLLNEEDSVAVVTSTRRMVSDFQSIVSDYYVKPLQPRDDTCVEDRQVGCSASSECCEFDSVCVFVVNLGQFEQICVLCPECLAVALVPSVECPTTCADPVSPTTAPSDAPVERQCVAVNLGTQDGNCGALATAANQGLDCCDGGFCMNTIDDQFQFVTRCTSCDVCRADSSLQLLNEDCAVCNTGSPSLSPTNPPVTTDPTPNPSQSPTSSTPSTTPSDSPSVSPITSNPSRTPSRTPSDSPSDIPSKSPSFSPETSSPTVQPSTSPSRTPSGSPSAIPSSSPATTNPSSSPDTQTPSSSPDSSAPSSSPDTSNPSRSPFPGTDFPSVNPTQNPSISPETSIPTKNPTQSPTAGPSFSDPTSSPSVNPTVTPSDVPSGTPSRAPVFSDPTRTPSNNPTGSPSFSDPTNFPSTNPTGSPSIVPSGTPSNSPSTSVPSQSPSTTPTKGPSSSPVTSDPTKNPSASPTARPSLSPSSSNPSRTPSKTPTVSPVTSDPTPTPSNAPSRTPSNSPSVSAPTYNPSVCPTVGPSRSPVPQPSGTPSITPSKAPTLICDEGTYLDIGSDAIQLSVEESSLSGTTLTLTIIYPEWFTVTEISFSESVASLFYLEDGANVNWQNVRKNNCQFKMVGTFEWENIYQGQEMNFDVVKLGGFTYLENNMVLKLDQTTTAREQELVRKYTYNILWRLQIEDEVQVEFDVLEIYADNYYTEAEPLCTPDDEVIEIVAVFEHSDMMTEAEFLRLNEIWGEGVASSFTDVMKAEYKLATITFGDWQSQGGVQVDQPMEDWVTVDRYVQELDNIEYQSAPVTATQDALQAAVNQFDTFNNVDRRFVVLFTYREPTDQNIPGSDVGAQNVCDAALIQQYNDLDVTLSVVKVTNRDTDFDVAATFSCLTSITATVPSVDALNGALFTTQFLNVNCDTTAELCQPSQFTANTNVYQGQYAGVTGTLKWDHTDGIANVQWDQRSGWIFQGYQDTIISTNPTASVSPIPITDITTWYIVPCGTGVPEEWPYFRAGVLGESLCRVGDAAGFDDPSSVTTEATIPSEYFSQIGTVTAVAQTDASLSCAGQATAVTYDDSSVFLYCPSEISCSDWAERCEDDSQSCSSCIGYASSSTDFLVSSKDWVALPTGVECSFGTFLGYCAAEVDGVAYQCLGNQVLNTGDLRRELKTENRRELQAQSGPCHGLWGPWSSCSSSCGNGIQWREYVWYSGSCPVQDGAKDFQACISQACPELVQFATHHAYFTPDLNGRRSTMNLHFTTIMNAPWKFAGHDINVVDTDGTVDTSTVRVTLVEEHCSGIENCVQEWRLEYMTTGVCDADGIHLLTLLPTGAEESMDVPIALSGAGCGSVTNGEIDNSYETISSGEDEPTHTMTVTMTVAKPRDPEKMDTQVGELVSIVSKNMNDASVEEISRVFAMPIQVVVEHSDAASSALYDFFDQFPISVGSVLEIPAAAVKDFAVGASGVSTSMTVRCAPTASEGQLASDIYSQLSDRPMSFSSALSIDLRSYANWLNQDVTLSTVESMTVSVTMQALASDDFDLNALVSKLEALGYQVEIHDDFGHNMVPISQQQTVPVTTEVTTTSSNSSVWKALFATIVFLFFAIVATMCYKRSADRKQQRALKAAKLYEYESRKSTKENDVWAQTEDPLPTLPYDNNKQ